MKQQSLAFRLDFICRSYRSRGIRLFSEISVLLEGRGASPRRLKKKEGRIIKLTSLILINCRSGGGETPVRCLLIRPSMGMTRGSRALFLFSLRPGKRQPLAKKATNYYEDFFLAAIIPAHRTTGMTYLRTNGRTN